MPVYWEVGKPTWKNEHLRGALKADVTTVIMP